MINSMEQKAVDKQIAILLKQLYALRREIFIYGESKYNLSKLQHDLNKFTDIMFNYVDEEDMADSHPL